MTREELLALVNDKEDTSRLTSLSQQTIEEELDDLLGDYGEDEAPDDSAVEKLAKRLRRMDGNIHASVSSEMKKNREEAERRRKKGVRKSGAQEGSEGEAGDDRYAALLARVNQLIEANEARDKAEKKKSLADAVCNGLKARFGAANLEVNDFFVETAMSKLDLPEEGADVKTLVAEAERLYTADYKRAMGNVAMPHAGGMGRSREDVRVDEHEWDDIKEACKNGRAMGIVR